MFAYKFRYKFEAAHRFTKSCSEKCMTPHGHTWYASLFVQMEPNDHFKDTQMPAEFQALKSDWKHLIDEIFDHSFLVNANDPLIDSLKLIHPTARVIEFPGDPTTELIGMCLLHKARVLLSQKIKTNPELSMAKID
jgi:6-pyruvoyltetrahydropterin/6-carboxytetrahydropterin synthase